MHARRISLLTGIATLVVTSTLVGAAPTGPAGAEAPADRSPASYVGHRGPLPTQGAARRPARRSPGPGDINRGAELKSPEVEGEESTPHGGQDVQQGQAAAPSSASVPVTRSQAGVVSRFAGLDHFDSRYSGGGNQFSGEPPDQGMCVGNGRVFEIINSVVQVYTTGGRPLIEGDKAFPDGPSVGLTLNEFYGLPPTFVRPAGPFGPFMFDTSCLYDPSTKRWFVTSANLDQDPTTGAFTGANQVWLAVSDSRNPLGGWSIWTIDTTNNGENGTPDHGCPDGACFGDYPQIGLDAHGFYVTTNEFEFFGDGFNGAQVYALSKSDLVAGRADVTMQLFENVQTSTYQDVAYTLQPVNALPSDWDRRAGGSMYFGMSGSSYSPDVATSIVLYGLEHTSTLDGSSPQLTLSETAADTQAYAVPGFAQQRNGPMPLLACVNDVNCIGVDYPTIQRPSVLDAGNSGKVYGAWLHDGDVYLTTGTPLDGTGAATYDESDGSWAPIHQRTGVAWFVLRPEHSGGLGASLVTDGYLAVRGANLTYPSIAVGPDGGAIGATLTGPAYYPSAAVARFAPGEAPGSVQITGPGRGPQDGFTATGEGGYDPRWGDYGAATVTPRGVVWLASEYVATRCTVEEFNVDTTCGYERTFYANWSTHITAVRPPA